MLIEYDFFLDGTRHEIICYNYVMIIRKKSQKTENCVGYINVDGVYDGYTT